jgi:hypothetical protein
MRCDRMSLLQARDGHDYNDEVIASAVSKTAEHIEMDCECRTQEWAVKRHKSIVVDKHMPIVHVNMAKNVEHLMLTHTDCCHYIVRMNALRRAVRKGWKDK